MVNANLSSEKLAKLHEVTPLGIFLDINPYPDKFDSVQPDLSQTILDALDLLQRAGKKRIGFIGGVGSIMGQHNYRQDPRAFAFENWAFSDLYRAGNMIQMVMSSVKKLLLT